VNDKPPSAAEIAAALQAYVERSQEVLAQVLKRQADDGAFEVPNRAVVARTFATVAERMLADPERLATAQAELARDYMALWQATARRFAGETSEPVATPARDDRRFKDQDWTENPLFDFYKQFYLVSSRWLHGRVREAAAGVDPHTARMADFYTRQMIDALSPTNFVLTNPTVLRETVATGGQNLMRGLDRLLRDLERGQGDLRISMTDSAGFRLGETIALSPGKVVYQNDLMQLIQYAPATETVFKRPLLIVPPWINKFYILDLRPRNSLIAWLVGQGHTVFVVSWVNPGPDLAHKGFADYMLEGPVAAIDAIAAATGERTVNIIGYCIGGTLLGCALAWMAAKRRKRVASATFLTAMLDFAEAGELSVFIDEEQLDLLEKHMGEKGFLESRHMSKVFNLMRANDLIWSFHVNNYLMGKDPPPFDLLHWNADSTRMPAMMHGFYLRNMYHRNLLRAAGGITLDGVPIDLGRIAVPAYFLSTREDHIAPWRSTYAGARLLKGPVRFVLAASGHIAGVVNPPGGSKYGHWVNPALPADPEAWFAAAESRDGSWWPDWQAWVEPHGGGRVPARAPGAGKLPALEDAPGSYVRMKAED